MYKIGVYRIAGSRRCCYFADLWSYFKPFCVMIAALFWCAYTARGTSEYLPITRSFFAAELSQCLGKMADVNSVISNDFIKNTSFMPRLAICSRDLHWHWINRTLLCDTMEVSVLRWAWLAITQHMFQPACWQVGQSWFWKIVSRKLGPSCYRDFANNIALLGAKKWDPTCHRDIYNSAIYTTHIYREYTVLCIWL